MPRSKSRKCKEMIVWAFMELKPGLAQSRKKVISFRHFFQKEYFICRLCGKFSGEFHPELVKVFHLKICSVFLQIPVRKMRKLLYNNQ